MWLLSELFFVTFAVEELYIRWEYEHPLVGVISELVGEPNVVLYSARVVLYRNKSVFFISRKRLYPYNVGLCPT